MTWSVYDYTTRLYVYYTAPGPKGTHAGAPPRAAGSFAVGATPEAAAWRLPFGAKKIGEGVMPKGRIASTSFALGALGDLGELPRYAVYAGIVYVAWRVLVR